ncbi:MAG: PAS domain-containing protein [Thermoproteota archaeon]
MGKKIELETGSLSVEELKELFDTLPVDITFVDKDHTVKYFNKLGRRIFPRPKEVVGTKVQNCHPQKSVHVVNQILESFKSGERDKAEFWINLEGKMVHIRYFAVRNKEGEYLGVLEVSQDITHIQELTGEKRLLDWEA